MAEKGKSDVSGGDLMKREITFSKPNMANLRGKIGKSIIMTIRNSPKLNRDALKRKSDEVEARILAQEKHGAK